MNLEEIQSRCEASPELTPYVTAKGGVVIFNGPFPTDKAEAAKEFIVHAREDVSALMAEVEWLQSRLVRAHRMLLDDLAIIWPEPGSLVEQLKARLLHEVQEYLGEDNG